MTIRPRRERLTGGTSSAGFPTPDVAYSAFWEARGAGGGSFNVVDDVVATADGGAATGTIAPNNNNGAQVEVGETGLQIRVYTGTNNFWNGRQIIVRGVWQTRYDAIGVQANHFQGLSDVVGGVDPLSGGTHSIGIGVQKLANAIFGNLLLTTNDGATVHTYDSGIPIVLSQRYKWELDINGGSAVLLINGLQAVVGANIPNNVLTLCWALNGHAGTPGTNMFAIMEYLYGQNATP